MRILIPILTLGALLAFATPASALVYATAASNAPGGSGLKITNLSKGYGIPDNQRTKFETIGSSGHTLIKFTFVKHTFHAGDHGFAVLVDGTVTGTVTAQVQSVNGSSVTGGKTTISGSNLSDALFPVSFALSSQTDLTTITVRFDLTGSTAIFEMDTFGTPEPGTWALFGVGAVALLSVRRFRRRRRSS